MSYDSLSGVLLLLLAWHAGCWAVCKAKCDRPSQPATLTTNPATKCLQPAFSTTHAPPGPPRTRAQLSGTLLLCLAGSQQQEACPSAVLAATD